MMFNIRVYGKKITFKITHSKDTVTAEIGLNSNRGTILNIMSLTV